MSKRIQLLIPMSGQGTRYQKAGYNQPKPLIPVNGRSMIERLLEKCPREWPTIFVMAENHRGTELPELLKTIRPEATQLFIEPHQKGPSYAVQAALPSLKDAPVLVSYCDYGLVWDPLDFERFVNETACDAALVSYKGFHAHYLSPVPYAYSRMEGELVKEVREKGSFTNERENEYASCGAYYFASPRILSEAIESQEKLNLSLNGEFYTSLTIEGLLKAKPDAHVRVYEIPAFFQWGTPEDLAIFEYWEKTFRAKLKWPSSPGSTSQVLMPMAGLGSRFQKLFAAPKPFLEFGGAPMFRHALRSLPKATAITHFVALNSCASALNTKSGETATFLDVTPSGQALSVEAGLTGLRNDADLVISSCDQEIVLDPEIWKEFICSPDCDAAIFTIKGFPGTLRSPKSFAYVDTRDDQKFAEVKSVSVKNPISSKPSNDRLLVGTFWFKDKSVLTEGLKALKAKDVRVNGELYLDSVFDILIAAGKTVRVIPLDGYINFGDPDSLSESLYWTETFLARKERPRRRWDGVNG